MFRYIPENENKTIIVDMQAPEIMEFWIACTQAHPHLEEWEARCKEQKEITMPWGFHGMDEINRHTERELNYLLGIRLLDSNNKPLFLTWERGYPSEAHLQNGLKELDIRYLEFTIDRIHLYNSLLRANMHFYDNDDGDYQAGYIEPLLYFIDQFFNFCCLNPFHQPKHNCGTYDTNQWLKDCGEFKQGFNEIGVDGYKM